jgi:hypothetical protein
MKKVFIVMMALCLGLVPVASAGRGQVLYQIWDGTTGALPELKANPNFPDNPTSTWVLPSIDGAVDRVDSAYAAINNFGSRISGWIIPPETANYTFAICSDDNSELWLSTSEDPNNIRRISRVTASAPHQRWGDTDIHVDESSIALVAGQKYYFETIQDEGSGGDNVSVGWISDGTVIGTGYSVVGRDYVWIPDELARSVTNRDMAGTVLYEHYDNISGGNVAALTSNVNYPNNPAGQRLLFNGIDAPQRYNATGGDVSNFGSRVTGYIIPPETANYTFKVCADDRGEFHLSADDNPANAVLISANANGYAGRNAFTDTDLNPSSPIPLVKGRKYFFMALGAEGSGGDNVSVGWLSDGTVIGSTWSDGTANVVGRDYVTAYGYWASENVNPRDGAVGINPSQDIILKWAPGFLERPIVEYRVYFSNDPAIGVPAAGQTPLAVVAADDPNGVKIDKNTLGEGVDYYWRVDAFAAPSKGLGDPNNRAGDMWTFKTIRTTPIVDRSPASMGAWRDEVVTFSVDVRSGENNNQGALTYDWRDAVGSLGAPSLPVLEVTVGTQDRSFYCVATNVNGSQTSGTAQLHVKKWVGWWKFDEGSGTVAADSSPEYYRVTATPNDAVRAGAGTDNVWTANGKIGGALALDGEGEYFATGKLPSVLGIVGNNPRSFCVWVKTMGWNNGGIYDMGDHTSTAHDFSLRTLSGTANVDQWRIQYYGADRDFWTWRDDGDRAQATRAWFFQSHNNWTHFVHIHDGANTKLYANGILIIDWPRTLDTFDVHPLDIGVYNHSNEFQGLIDDLRVFNFALSRQEVIDIYVDGEPGASFCDGSNLADVNNDCIVDIKDLADVAEKYLGSGIRSN